MDPRVPVILRMRRGAGWFFTIALLSGVNSVLQIFNAQIRFIFGLGITQVVDGMARGMGQGGTVVIAVVDGLFIVMLIVCSRWAKAGSQGAFLGGMVAYALWMIWQGYAASRELAHMQQAAQPGLSLPRLP